MAASRSTIGYLSEFFIGDDSSPIAYTEMLEVKSMTPNFFTVPVVDATHFKSPNATSEKKPGLIMPGTIEVTGNFIGDATQLNIVTLAQARTVFPFKFTEQVDDGTKTATVSATGFIGSFGQNQVSPSTLGEFRLTIEIAGGDLTPVVTDNA